MWFICIKSRNFAKMIRFSPGPQSIPQRGSLLLSEPFLDDPYFGRKGVLICEIGEGGTFGFVLNNFVDVDLHAIASEIPEGFGRVSVGGPVNVSTLYYLHRLSDLDGATPVYEGLFMGGDFPALVERLQSGQVASEDIRFFVGYAGWSENQLEEEIQSRSWFVTKAAPEALMDTTIDGEDFWKQRIAAMGEDFQHIANAPSDPSLN